MQLCYYGNISNSANAVHKAQALANDSLYCLSGFGLGPKRVWFLSDTAVSSVWDQKMWLDVISSIIYLELWG